ncbi:MAG: CBS domain-containing protein [Pseudomonadota bacterium]
MLDSHDEKHSKAHMVERSDTKIQARTLITSHSNPDFDALGSMVAASKLYDNAVLIMPSGNNQTVQKFLHGPHFASAEGNPFAFVNAKDVDFSCVLQVVLVDTRQTDRVPHIAHFLHDLQERNGLNHKGNKVLIDLWDHHPDSDGDIQADAVHVAFWGSTAALLVQNIRKQGIKLSPQEATIIGLGIYDDTGSFTFASTTSHDMEAAAWLMTQGMNLETVAELVRHDFSAEQISVLNMMLESAASHFISGFHVVFTSISLDSYLPDFSALVATMMDMSASDDKNALQHDAQEISAVFALARMGDKVQVVARSRVTEINVQTICAAFGGGGHPYAASASVKNKTLDEVHDTIFRQIHLSKGQENSMAKLMSTPAITVEQHRSIQHAEEIMNRFGLKAVPVVLTNTKLCIGYLEYQIASRAMAHKLGNMPISAYMQRNFHSITRHATLQQVMDIIIEHRQRIVPVVHVANDVEAGGSTDVAALHEQDGNIIGVVTRTDLINAIVDASARKPEMLLSQTRKARNVRPLMQEKLPQHIREVLEHAGRLGDRLGLDVYTVGGFVRDLLLGQPNHDLDIVVEGDGIAFAKIFAQELQGRVREHEAFKTALIIYNDGRAPKGHGTVQIAGEEQRIDVATARLEYYEYPAALPSVELSSIKMDLFRRDFTINALALQLNGPHFGKLVDFFNAQNDIKKGVVRVLHSLSFVEDPTRMMRAIRFEQRYNFSLGQQTLRLMKNALELELIEKLSGARIYHEFNSISKENNAIDCFKRMHELGMLTHIHEKLALTPQKITIMERMDDVLTWYDLLYIDTKPERWLVWLLCLSHGIKHRECLEIAQRLALTPSQTKRFLAIHEYVLSKPIFTQKVYQDEHANLQASVLYTLFTPLDLEGILYAMAMANNENLRKQSSHYLNVLQHIKADIDGHDLRSMGLETGPQYAIILQKIFYTKLDGEAPNRALQLAMARNLIEQVEKSTKTG